MDVSQVRIELLRLIVPQHSSIASGNDTDSMITKAKALEAYVLQQGDAGENEDTQKKTRRRRTQRPQSEDNSQEPAQTD